jgi:hypothetical protein
MGSRLLTDSQTPRAGYKTAGLSAETGALGHHAFVM